MQLKNNYKNEVINKARIIIALIMFMIMLSVGWIEIKQLIDEEISIGLFIMSGIIFMGVPGVFVYYTCKSIYTAKANREKSKEIIENGIKVPGIIREVKEDYEQYTDTNGHLRSRYYYYLIVEYTNNWNKCTVESPRINFHPDYLRSKEVDVYLYEDSFYIDNFILDTEKMEIDKKKNIIENIIAMILFVLISIAIVIRSITSVK